MLGQILTSEQFDKIFRSKLKESNDSVNLTDPVLKWYMSKGINEIRNFDFESEIMKTFGYDSMPDDDDEFETYTSYFDDIESAAFKDAIIKFITEHFSPNMFEFAGCGAAKATFITKSGHALKFGRNRGTLLKNEILTNLNGNGLKCFPKLFAYAPDYTSYMCECARESTAKDFQEIWGSFGVKRARDLVRLVYDEDPDFYKYLISSKNTENSKTILDLIKYNSTAKRYLTDIDENNWGVTVRNGEKTLIIIDYDL